MRNRIICIPVLLFLVMAYPSLALSGEIYGSVINVNLHALSNVEMTIGCAGDEFTTITDKYGSYRVRINQKGKCVLQLHYANQTPSITIFTYSRPVRYDLILEQAEGKFFIRRK